MGSHPVIEVAQAAVTLGGAVELGDLWDVEPFHELLPDGLAQAVAQRHAHPMLLFRVSNGLIQQISANLSYVLNDLEGKAGRNWWTDYCFNELKVKTRGFEELWGQ